MERTVRRIAHKEYLDSQLCSWPSGEQRGDTAQEYLARLSLAALCRRASGQPHVIHEDLRGGHIEKIIVPRCATMRKQILHEFHHRAGVGARQIEQICRIGRRGVERDDDDFTIIGQGENSTRLLPVLQHNSIGGFHSERTERPASDIPRGAGGPILRASDAITLDNIVLFRYHDREPARQQADVVFSLGSGEAGHRELLHHRAACLFGLCGSDAGDVQEPGNNFIGVRRRLNHILVNDDRQVQLLVEHDLIGRILSVATLRQQAQDQANQHHPVNRFELVKHRIS